MKERNSCLTMTEIQERLRSAGVNPTAQRIAICQYVLCQADHPTAEQVKSWADKNFPKISLATVYNTLGTLVKAGLLKELKLPHSESVIYDDRVSDHHHFLDEASGELIDILPEQIEVTTKLKKNFKITGVDVLIRGTVR
jgi:Fe2+ or Zn2+ uptake regulation protein